MTPRVVATTPRLVALYGSPRGPTTPSGPASVLGGDQDEHEDPVADVDERLHAGANQRDDERRLRLAARLVEVALILRRLRLQREDDAEDAADAADAAAEERHDPEHERQRGVHVAARAGHHRAAGGREAAAGRAEALRRRGRAVAARGRPVAGGTAAGRAAVARGTAPGRTAAGSPAVPGRTAAHRRPAEAGRPAAAGGRRIAAA